MDFEVHCMSILPTELSLFNYDRVKSVLQSMTPLNIPTHAHTHTHTSTHMYTILTHTHTHISLMQKANKCTESFFLRIMCVDTSTQTHTHTLSPFSFKTLPQLTPPQSPTGMVCSLPTHTVLSSPGKCVCVSVVVDISVPVQYSISDMT